jgi:hypothetical protein
MSSMWVTLRHGQLDGEGATWWVDYALPSRDVNGHQVRYLPVAPDEFLPIWSRIGPSVWVDFADRALKARKTLSSQKAPIVPMRFFEATSKGICPVWFRAARQ